MSHILMALILFLIVVVAHLLYCCYQKKEGLHTKTFFIWAFLGLSVLWFIFALFPFDPFGPDLKSTATIMYLFLIPVCLFFYRAIDLVSPSKKLFQMLRNNQKPGYEQLLAGIKEENFIEKCLDELIEDGYVCKKEDKFFLTVRGEFLARFIKFYQTLTGKILGG